jgi:hypothetical protein
MSELLERLLERTAAAVAALRSAGCRRCHDTDTWITPDGTALPGHPLLAIKTLRRARPSNS